MLRHRSWSGSPLFKADEVLAKVIPATSNLPLEIVQADDMFSDDFYYNFHSRRFCKNSLHIFRTLISFHYEAV